MREPAGAGAGGTDAPAPGAAAAASPGGALPPGVVSTVVLTVPGYNNAGPEHWLTHWERVYPGVVRVQQDDWDDPERAAWVHRLEQAIAGAGDVRVLLAAHSLGCIAIAHWARARSAAHRAAGAGPQGTARRVAGALLVAPADVEQPATPPALQRFAPVPLLPLPFPSIVVASRDDPWAVPDRSRAFAAAWDARFVDAGNAGHLDSAAGLGAWPGGWQMLQALLGDTPALRSP